MCRTTQYENMHNLAWLGSLAAWLGSLAAVALSVLHANVAMCKLTACSYNVQQTQNSPKVRDNFLSIVHHPLYCLSGDM